MTNCLFSLCIPALKIAGAATNLRACISFSHGRAGKEQGSTIWGCLKTGGYPKIISKYPKMHQNAIFERGNEVQAAEWNAVFPKVAFKPFGSCNNYNQFFHQTFPEFTVSAKNLQENHSFHGQFHSISTFLIESETWRCFPHLFHTF